MTYEQGLTFDLILPAVKVPHRKQVLQTIAEETSKVIGIREKLLFSRLATAAEATLVQGGVCLVELKISSLTQPFMTLARAPLGIDTGAADNHPADIFAIFLYPEHGGTAHLQTLARWSRLLRDASFCQKLRACADDEDIRLLMKAETKLRQIAA